MADVVQQQDVAPAPQEATTTNLVSPGGDLVSVPNEQVKDALHPNNGYRMATPEDEAAYDSNQKYGTPGQIAQTAAEGAIRTASFGAIPGIGSAEDIEGRQKENPVADVAGSVVPFVAEQFVPGAGQAGAAGQLARAATLVPRAIGEAGEAITGASGLTGVGAKALQYSAESAIMQGSNEVSKALLKDPDQTAANVIADEGLAALFGGALGVASGGIGKAASLWESKFGSKATDAIIDKSAPDIASQELQSGIEIPPSMRDALSGDQDAYNKVQVLQKSDTMGGRAMQNDVSKIYDQAQDKTLESLGADPRLVDKAPDAYAAGTNIKDAIAEGIKAGQDLYGPAYDEIKSKYKNIPIGADQKAAFAGKLTQALSEAGLGSLEGSAEKSTMGNIFKSLDNIHDADGIKSLNTGLNNAAKNPELQRLAAVASPVIKDFESSVVQAHLGQIDPTGELLAKRKAADAAYKQAMSVMSDVKQAVGLGRFKGTNGFLRALDDKPPEQIMQRLSNKNRQDMIKLLEEKFPAAAEEVKNFHINDQLHDAKLPDGSLNTRKFLNNFLDTGHNPEHIQNLMTGSNPAALQRLSAIKNILNAVPKDGNPSNSAAMLDKLWKGKLGTIAGGVLGIGGGHLSGGILGGIGEHVLSEINPFLSYKMLELRGGGKSIIPGNIKAMFDYAKAAAQGRAAVNKAVDNVFTDKPVVGNSHIPTDLDKQRLDRYVGEVTKNPEKLQNTASGLTDLMPDHMPSLSMTASKAASYLNSIKPRSGLGMAFDSVRAPSADQKGEYQRQLGIAQQPLMAVKYMKDGTLTPNDLNTLQNCHPAQYQQLKQQIAEKMIGNQSTIPYKTRLSMSLFLGQPLDSTMTPQAIIAAQPVPQDQQPQGGAPGNRPKRSTSSLNKLPGMYKTQGQSSEQDRSNRE